VGTLAVGDQLPLVRQVVADLALNANTVLKAYRELESRGLAQGRPGLGTFVTSALGEVPFAVQAALGKKLAGWIRSARAAGLDDQVITALFATTLHDGRAEPVG
jgi:GntR family transcriptional regulator